MIQNINNILATNIYNKPKAPLAQTNTFNHASAPDVFVKNTQNAPTFKGLPYSSKRAEQLSIIAFDAEEEEQDFQGAEKILTKNFLEIEKHIKNTKKDAQGKIIPIKRKHVIDDYTDATLNLVSNLGIQKQTVYDEYDDDDEAEAKSNELQQRSVNYMQRAINVGEKYFDPKAFAVAKEDLLTHKKAIDSGNTIDRTLEVGGKETTVYDYIGLGEDSSDNEDEDEAAEGLGEKSFEQIMGGDDEDKEAEGLGERSFEQIMGDDDDESSTAQLGKRDGFDGVEYPTHPTTPEEIKAENKKVLEVRETTRQQLKQFIPEEVENDVYNADDARAIESFTSLSILAANNASKEHKPASGAPNLKKAYRMIDISQKFLQKKDPQQIYWDSNDFKIARNTVSETVGTNTMDKETPDDFETLMSVQNEELPLQKRLGHLDKLAAAPTLLGMIVAFDMHDAISKSAIDLLSRHKSEEAKEQLQNIIKDKDIKDHIKAFATQHLIKK